MSEEISPQNSSFETPAPDSAFIVSQVIEKPPIGKYIQVGIVVGVFVFLLGAIGGGIYLVSQTTQSFSKAQENHEKQISAILDDTTTGSTTFSGLQKVEAEEYQNPFEENINYVNPFDEQTNPFDEIAEN